MVTLMRDRQYALSFRYSQLVYKLNIDSYHGLKAMAVHVMAVYAMVLSPELAVLKGKWNLE